MSATVRKWVLIYLAVLVAMLLIAKYPYLLRGQAPVFFEGEFLRTLIMAGVGTGLIEVMIWRWNLLRERMGRKPSR